MPLRNGPPRPPDGPGRQTPPGPAGRPGPQARYGQTVASPAGHRRVMVAVIAVWVVVAVVRLVGFLVAGWWSLSPTAVACSVVSLVASVAGLVAAWSGGRQ